MKRMLLVAGMAEVNCIHYRGTDEYIHDVLGGLVVSPQQGESLAYCRRCGEAARARCLRCRHAYCDEHWGPLGSLSWEPEPTPETGSFVNRCGECKREFHGDRAKDAVAAVCVGVAIVGVGVATSSLVLGVAVAAVGAIVGRRVYCALRRRKLQRFLTCGTLPAAKVVTGAGAPERRAPGKQSDPAPR
ncbi:hypothetical protein [Haliangium sp.]|uniref:hypothetical protein n=1 Tax=Haliangium sp. TaxID=2663208 RepID=UPI003D13D3B0